MSAITAKMDAMPAIAANTDPLVAELDDEQREAVLAPRGPVCVLAGAGTGKTRTITHRIAQLVATGHVAAGQVLAVTFTQRAAGEMRTRLRALGAAAQTGVGAVQAVTFHAAAHRQLRYFWPRVVGDTGWQLLDTKFAVVARGATSAGLKLSTDDVRDVAGEIEWAKASLISPEQYPDAVAAASRDVPLDAARVAAVYTAYESLKARGDGVALLDFDDLLLHTAAAIENDAAVAEEFRNRYRCFVVDEYQDVTPLQQRVLSAWLGDRDDLTVVGDANQTIYSFTGASPRYLLDFSRRFPDATVVRLERDYRSTPQVVSLANRVIASARGRVAGSKLHLVGQRDPGPEPTFRDYPDEVAEAAAVAASISRLVDAGTPPSEIAVLYRINAQSEVYEEALTEAGIAYQVRGGEGFFSRQEIRQALLALQRAANRDGRRRGPTRAADVVRGLLEPLGLTAEPPTGTRARERWEALVALAELVDEEVTLRPSLNLHRAGRRAADPRRLASPTRRAGRHAGVAARRQGPGVGRGVPGRLDRRHAAHLARAGPRRRERGSRRGTSTALRRNHQGPSAFGDQLGAGPQPGRTAESQVVTIPQRAVAADAGRPDAEPSPPQKRTGVALPDLQQPVEHPGGDHACAAARRAPPTSTTSCCLRSRTGGCAPPRR